MSAAIRVKARSRETPFIKFEEITVDAFLQKSAASNFIFSNIQKLLFIWWCRPGTPLVGKIFYDLIVLEKGQDSLSEEEIKFGKTNLELRPSAFINSVKLKIENLSKVLNNGNLSESTKIQVTNQIKELEKYV